MTYDIRHHLIGLILLKGLLLQAMTYHIRHHHHQSYLDHSIHEFHMEMRNMSSCMLFRNEKQTKHLLPRAPKRRSRQTNITTNKKISISNQVEVIQVFEQREQIPT